MLPATWATIRLTAELAALSTLLLLLIGTPLAWWLARTRSRAKPVIASLVALPLVLPPSVLGFYLLLLMGPNGPVVIHERRDDDAQAELGELAEDVLIGAIGG